MGRKSRNKKRPKFVCEEYIPNGEPSPVRLVDIIPPISLVRKNHFGDFVNIKESELGPCPFNIKNK